MFFDELNQIKGLLFISEGERSFKQFTLQKKYVTIKKTLMGDFYV